MGLELAPSRSPFAHFDRSVPATRAQVRVSTILAAAAFADALAAAILRPLDSGADAVHGSSPSLPPMPSPPPRPTNGTNGTTVAASCTWPLK